MEEKRTRSWVTKFLIAVGLFIGSFFLVSVSVFIGLPSWIVPAFAFCIVAYSFYRPEWSILNFSPRGIKTVFGVIGAFLLMGLFGGGESLDEKYRRDKEAKSLAALAKVNPEEARKRVAAANGALQQAVLAKQEEEAKIAEIEKRVSELPEDDHSGRMDAYKQLRKLDPSSNVWPQKIADIEAKVEQPERYVEFELTSWRKDGFGSVMMVSGIIKNDSAVTLKDFTLLCEHSAPSGTIMDRNERIIYERVPAGSRKTIRDFNMGFIQEQAAGTSCRIIDAARA